MASKKVGTGIYLVLAHTFDRIAKVDFFKSKNQVSVTVCNPGGLRF